MSQLSYTLKELECRDGKKATVVALEGSVDPASLDKFDSIFDELLDNGSVRVIMDLENLKYINSTGMGMMVQYYDQLCDEGGGLVLLTVQAKVILVLEMLGLQELFPIVATEEEALAALMGDEVVPASVEVHLENESEPVVHSGETITCGSCNAELLTAGSGSYFCPRCHAVIEVDNSQQAHTYPPANGDSVEISVPAAVPFFKSAAALLARIGIKSGLSDTDVMNAAASIQGTLGKMNELCFVDDEGQSQCLEMIGSAKPGHFEVHIFCSGRTISSTEDIARAAEGFDEINFTPVSGGNLVKLCKNVS